jgi:hypothetical protein
MKNAPNRGENARVSKRVHYCENTLPDGCVSACAAKQCSFDLLSNDKKERRLNLTLLF